MEEDEMRWVRNNKNTTKRILLFSSSKRWLAARALAISATLFSSSFSRSWACCLVRRWASSSIFRVFSTCSNLSWTKWADWVWDSTTDSYGEREERRGYWEGIKSIAIYIYKEDLSMIWYDYNSTLSATSLLTVSWSPLNFSSRFFISWRAINQSERQED